MSALLQRVNNPDDYWCIGGNYWCKGIYAYAVALELASTMVNCINCINCRRCTDCSHCIYINDCIDCRYCKYCRNCTGLRTKYDNDFDHDSSECNYLVSEYRCGYELRSIDEALRYKLIEA